MGTRVEQNGYKCQAKIADRLHHAAFSAFDGRPMHVWLDRRSLFGATFNF